MKKITRSLLEIKKEIEQHRAAITTLEKEIVDFQAACPHPEQFVTEQHKSTDDEYGRIDQRYVVKTCMLCGLVRHTDHQDVY